MGSDPVAHAETNLRQAKEALAIAKRNSPGNIAGCTRMVEQRKKELAEAKKRAKKR